MGLLQRPSRGPLIQCKKTPAASGTHILVVHLARRRRKSVVETELVQHGLEVVDVQTGRVVFAAPAARRALAGLAGLLVKGNAERQGPLYDMKQLSKWQVQQQADHAGGMGQTDERKNRNRP